MATSFSENQLNYARKKFYGKIYVTKVNLSFIDKLILRLSLTEMFFFDEIPNKVSIVEGVEIAKIYGNTESSAFVNGVLDSLYNDLEDNKIKI